MKKVAVGLSGGVDSSTAIAMLRDQGHDVVGVTLWLMKGKGQCCSEGMVDAAQLCESMGIDHHIVDSRESFERYIVDYLVDGYQAGITPLPCSNCNKAVKFGPMLKFAQAELGIDYIATGHYARIHYDDATNRYQLLRAFDRRKDHETYFLYDLDQYVLGHVLFPLGETEKSQTRQMAAEFGLHTAEKPESMDLCLVEANGSMQAFLDKYIPTQQGEIVGSIRSNPGASHRYPPLHNWSTQRFRHRPQRTPLRGWLGYRHEWCDCRKPYGIATARMLSAAGQLGFNRRTRCAD